MARNSVEGGSAAGDVRKAVLSGECERRWRGGRNSGACERQWEKRVVSGNIAAWLRDYHDLEAVIEEWERTLGSGADSGREARNGAGLNGMAACINRSATNEGSDSLWWIRICYVKRARLSNAGCANAAAEQDGLLHGFGYQ